MRSRLETDAQMPLHNASTPKHRDLDSKNYDKSSYPVARTEQQAVRVSSPRYLRIGQTEVNGSYGNDHISPIPSR
jgi:hypothetical protein